MRTTIDLRIFGAAVLSSLSLHAQEPIWLSHYGNGDLHGFNEGMYLASDGADHLYGTGSIGYQYFDFDGHQLTVQGHSDIFLVKIDSLGNVIWAQRAGGTVSGPNDDFEKGNEIVYDAGEAHVLIAGRYAGNPSTFGAYQIYGDPTVVDMFVAAYDTAGTCLWARGTWGIEVYAQRLLSDGASNVFVFGLAQGGEAAFQETPVVHVPEGGFLAKYSSTGVFQSAQRIMLNGFVSDAEWVGNDWVLCGQYSGNASLWGQALTAQATGTEGILAKTDTTGAIQWMTIVGSDSLAGFVKCARTSTGDWVTLGYFKANAFIGNDTLTSAPDQYSFFVARFDSLGHPIWSIPILDPNPMSFYDLCVGPNDAIYLQGEHIGEAQLGSITLPATSSAELVFARLDTAGTVQAALSLGRRNLGIAGSLLSDSQGLFVSAVYDTTLVWGSQVYPNQTWDLFVAKLDGLDGFTSIRSMQAANEQLHIYANPNNGQCTIDLPQSLRITNDLLLTIYNETGEVVQRIPLTRGSQGVKLDIRAQAKGVYHVELGDGEQRYTGSIVFE